MMHPAITQMVKPQGGHDMKQVGMMLSAFGLILALAMPGWAQVRQLPTETKTVEGTVETIDQARRAVNIKTSTGEFVSVNVPATAKRLSEVKVGDKVKVTYNNNVMARLKEPNEPAVDTLSVGKAVGTGEGARPGGTVAIERVMTATIAEIDKNASSMTFVGPNNWKYSRHIVDPTILDKVKVGDRVDITWNTDVTVSMGDTFQAAATSGPPTKDAPAVQLSLEAPSLATLNDGVDVVAMVYDGQGKPVSGVPVEFRVASGWENNVDLMPKRPVTEQNGEAHTTFRGRVTGIVPLSAHVGDVATTVNITLSTVGSVGPGRQR
jgi:hypothetical protein